MTPEPMKWAALDGYSPGLAKLMCRAGAMSSGYEAASADLKAYRDWRSRDDKFQRLLNLQVPEIRRHGRGGLAGSTVTELPSNVAVYAADEPVGLAMEAPYIIRQCWQEASHPRLRSAALCQINCHSEKSVKTPGYSHDCPCGTAGPGDRRRFWNCSSQTTIRE